jgi:dTDP-4-dehydrorhamnose reductase
VTRPQLSDRWLVTGASGQLGRSLCSVCAEEGIEAVGLRHADLDVSAREAVRETLRRLRPAILVNCAAFTQVDRCERDEEVARRTNADGPRFLAEAAAEVGTLLVHLSTDYVFSGETSRPIPEEAPAAPRSAYGRGKWEGEEAVREVGCDFLIVRSQWLFGPGVNFIRTIYDLSRRGAPLRVVDDQIGRPTWTRSLSQGILAAVRAGGRGSLHIACEGVASWFDLAVAVVGEAASRGWIARVPVEAVPTHTVPRPAQRPAYGVLSLERSRKLGIRLPHWREALARYLDSEEWSRA